MSTCLLEPEVEEQTSEFEYEELTVAEQNQLAGTVAVDDGEEIEPLKFIEASCDAYFKDVERMRDQIAKQHLFAVPAIFDPSFHHPIRGQKERMMIMACGSCVPHRSGLMTMHAER